MDSIDQADARDIARTLSDGLAAFRAGDPKAAAIAFASVLAVRPDDAAARINLANALWKAGEHVAASVEARYARERAPNRPEAWIISGAIALDTGKASDAAAFYAEALRLAPDRADALAGLAASHLAQNRHAAAIVAARRALAQQPDLVHARFTLATALSAAGASDEALAHYDHILEAQPGHARARLNRGNLLLDRDALGEADADLRAAIAADPSLKEAWASLCFARTIAGDLPEAIAAAERAIEIDPNFGAGHWNLSAACLLAGDLRRGFAEYDWRRRDTLFGSSFSPLPAPEWHGEPLAGKHLLVRVEQGFGDTIMLARFLPLLVAQAARVTLACPSALHRLFTCLPITRIPPDAVAACDPPADLAIDQMSLPHVLCLTEDTIPARHGYLSVAPDLIAQWRLHLPEARGRKRIGVVWAGNPGHHNDRRRSLPEGALGTLLAAPSLLPIALQHGRRTDEYAIVNPMPRVTDYADTAAIVAQLDAVVTVDTSVAHLAGALGVECHVLLSKAADWRWRLGTDRSIWYDSLMLHRQTTLGDWSGPIASVTAALA